MDNVNTAGSAAVGRVSSAFDLGHRAAVERDQEVNPFPAGSPEHHNFEVGHRFGSSLQRTAARDLASDFFARLG